MRMMRASTVSAPTCSARTLKAPRWLIVPERTLSPGRLRTGTGSPLIMLSSTYEAPSSTEPSTGMRSPGRTLMRSPTRIMPMGRSFSPSGVTMRAVLGCRPISLRMADEVLPFARSSSSFPSRTKAMIMPEAS